MALTLQPYDRRAAVLYAHEWAFGRNPQFYSFDAIGGDCTNFASQCLYAGAGIMNYTPTFGWYYSSVNYRSPSWTGVQYFYNFLLRNNQSVGPVAVETAMEEMQPGDFVQLSFNGEIYQHTPIVVQAEQPQSLGDILVAAHDDDADNRPLDSYDFRMIRFLHITGVRKP